MGPRSMLLNLDMKSATHCSSGFEHPWVSKDFGRLSNNRANESLFRHFRSPTELQELNFQVTTAFVSVSTLPILDECATIANKMLHEGALYIFFNKLRIYLQSPVSLVFIFEGPSKPRIKRGHQVQGHHEPWWFKLAKELIQYFGYHVREAPGEAEAELANLNCLGLINRVITSDSDVLIFGAKLVFRILSNKNRNFDDEFMVYSDEVLEKNHSLTLGSMVLIALSSGGNYDEGIAGCGLSTAQALARCGFGDELLKAACILNEDRLKCFLVYWRLVLQKELATNSKNMLGSCQPTLAAAIPPAFPNPAILKLYTNPITSSSIGFSLPNTKSWVGREPFIHELAQFCSDYFGWKTEAMLKAKFESLLWEGVFLQMLYSPLSLYNLETKSLCTPNTHATILSISHGIRKGQYRMKMGDGKHPKITVRTDNFISLMGEGFAASSGDNSIKVWVSKRAFKTSTPEDLQRWSMDQPVASSSHAELKNFHEVIDLTNVDGDD
ncbi:unnamed protein product [Cyclocybe aegerita]|uniref:XPG-I domain-containing protein n=1 Tax=Cyclocybe aegerita TaxID=1973307 RepID=A0A8S0WV80_CYCAE|nr:unnamed protein product [Cyclocybe aegerita]